jgi:hypothetical protein
MLSCAVVTNAMVAQETDGMHLLLIDDLGELWRGDSRRLRAAFDSPYSGGEFIEYAVKNLGFVAINMYGTSCQVRLRPGFVAEKALSGLRNWLEPIRFERVVISKFEGGWRDELVKATNLMRRLEEILVRGQQTRPDDFLASPMASASFDKLTPIADIIEGWTHLTNAYEAETIIRLLRAVFRDQFVVVKQQPDYGRLVFKEFGDKMYSRYETWRECAIGAPIEEQPDRAFGRWVAEAYREAMADGLPRLDKVDAILHCPEGGRYRRRYRRLIFPLAAGSAGQFLVGGSFDDNSVDLRIPVR